MRFCPSFLLVGDVGGGLTTHSHSPFYGRSGSPSVMLEELDRQAQQYMYLGMTAPNPWEQDYHVPRFMVRGSFPMQATRLEMDSGGAADMRSGGDSPPPDYQSLFGDRRYVHVCVANMEVTYRESSKCMYMYIIYIRC